jgi:hypothetical protein
MSAFYSNLKYCDLVSSNDSLGIDRSLNNYLCFATTRNFSLTKIIAVCPLQ